MSPAVRTLTIQRLQHLVADSTKPAVMRRAATLRLGRLRAATTRPKPAAPAPTEQAKFEAYQSFIVLSTQRTALFNKRRTAAEQTIFSTMGALMPAAAPTNSDPKAWTDFVAQISGLLMEIESLH